MLNRQLLIGYSRSQRDVGNIASPTLRIWGSRVRILPGAPLANSCLEPLQHSGVFPRPLSKVRDSAHVLSNVQPADRGTRQLLLFRRLGVPRHFFQARVPAERSDFIRAAARLRQPPRRGLAQAMRHAPFGQPGLANAVDHEIAETLRRERPPTPTCLLRHQAPKAPAAGSDAAAPAASPWFSAAPPRYRLRQGPPGPSAPCRCCAARCKAATRRHSVSFCPAATRPRTPRFPPSVQVWNSPAANFLMRTAGSSLRQSLSLAKCMRIFSFSAHHWPHLGCRRAAPQFSAHARASSRAPGDGLSFHRPPGARSPPDRRVGCCPRGARSRDF